MTRQRETRQKRGRKRKRTGERDRTFGSPNGGGGGRWWGGGGRERERQTDRETEREPCSPDGNGCRIHRLDRGVRQFSWSSKKGLVSGATEGEDLNGGTTEGVCHMQSDAVCCSVFA